MAKEKLIKDNPLAIPFGKAVRVGNYKLWRGNYVIASGKEKTTIECIHVSSLDGAWMVRIPSTSMLFGNICNYYTMGDTSYLEDFMLPNMQMLMTDDNRILHEVYRMLYIASKNPLLFMSDKEHEEWIKRKFPEWDKKKRKEHVQEWSKDREEIRSNYERIRKAYFDAWDEQFDKRRQMEEEALKNLEQDEIAEQSIKILQENAE